MAIRAGHATTRSPSYALGSGADPPVARIVALLLLLLPIGAWFAIGNIQAQGPSQQAVDIASSNPRSVFTDATPHFLPKPVAALPADANVDPEASVAQALAPVEAPVERVKVANTGVAGAILRASPPSGPRVAGLREGTQLEVLEHRQVDAGAEWLRVQTPGGVEGWVFSRLVAASD